MLKIETDKIVQIVTEQIPSAQAIYLFGSQATEMNSVGSDVDIAFFTPFECEAESVLIHQVKMQLEITLKKDVDFINLNQASTVLQFQITTTGTHLYVKDSSLVLQYETLVLSMYQRLQEERKDIIDEVISSGKVYA
jgi:uncharacterized protein